jgi:ATP-dependent Lhr-like helicase
MVDLLLARWMEPPWPGALHLSTLIHQVLALICQHGGVAPSRAYGALVGSGVFGEVSPELFKRLLRRMAEAEVGLIEQAPDGTLLLGPEAERLTAGHDFFAVFQTPEEYRIVHDGKPIGTYLSSTRRRRSSSSSSPAGDGGSRASSPAGGRSR